MSGISLGVPRDGTLVLVSSCLEELSNFEPAAPRWNMASMLFGASHPLTLTSVLAPGRNTVIAALGPDASEFIVNLHADLLDGVAGIFLVGDSFEELERAALREYHGDLVYLYRVWPGPAVLATLRRRFSGLRPKTLRGPDCTRDELQRLLDRIDASRSSPKQIPLVAWR